MDQIYIVYRTTNLLNGKDYFGIHKQKEGFGPNDFDGYLGSGKSLKKALKKHGKDNFIRVTLFWSDDFEVAKSVENDLVTKEVVECKFNYNIALRGGNYHPGINYLEELSEALIVYDEEKIRLWEAQFKKHREQEKNLKSTLKTFKKISILEESKSKQKTIVRKKEEIQKEREKIEKSVVQQKTQKKIQIKTMKEEIDKLIHKGELKPKNTNFPHESKIKKGWIVEGEFFKEQKNLIEKHGKSVFKKISNLHEPYFQVVYYNYETFELIY